MLKRSTLFITLTVLLFLSLNKESISQDKWWKNKRYKNEYTRIKYELCKKTFKDIGYGFLYKNINSITPYFDTQVYLNIVSNEKGYYSSSQAELILQDFMEYFTVQNFKYLRSSRFSTYAFVNGVYSYMKGSGRRDLGVTISIKYYDDKWYVDQININ